MFSRGFLLTNLSRNSPFPTGIIANLYNLQSKMKNLNFYPILSFSHKLIHTITKTADFTIHESEFTKQK
jgi:hypothetical protein